MLCATCFQPECPESLGGDRPRPGTHAVKPNPGEHWPRGYGEWAIHPDEASFTLHRGYALVEGVRQPIRFVYNEAFATVVHVEGTQS